jgi:phage head maturation protease
MSLQMESKDYIKNIDGAERRYFASEVRAVVVDGEAVRAVDGYAAKFNSTYYWVYYPLSKRSGAFDDCLNDDVRCLFNHDPNYILARSKEGRNLKARSGCNRIKIFLRFA